jgi:hypothetical protein
LFGKFGTKEVKLFQKEATFLDQNLPRTLNPRQQNHTATHPRVNVGRKKEKWKNGS